MLDKKRLNWKNETSLKRQVKKKKRTPFDTKESKDCLLAWDVWVVFLEHQIKKWSRVKYNVWQELNDSPYEIMI